MFNDPGALKVIHAYERVERTRRLEASRAQIKRSLEFQWESD